MQNATHGIFGSLGTRMRTPLVYLGAQVEHDETNDPVIHRYAQLSDPKLAETPARSVFRH